ncbi:MAG: hypothetical protein M3228_00070 [Actinomycetota bacterium]|nr:hypothetical protein [Actinomycetota bacterium]
MSTAASTAPALSTRNKVGLAIAGVLGLFDCAALLTPYPEEPGPPVGILVLDTILGVITVVAVVIGWRAARRSALRVAAGARILSAITALPAFFVDVPAAVKLLVSVFVVVTVVAVVLMLAPAQRAAAVTD